MDWENVAHLADVLAVPMGRLGAAARPRREVAIAEAASFSAGRDQSDRITTPLYGPFDDLWVAVSKPGKEADPSRSRVNPNDMTPCVLKDGSDTGYRPTFGDVYSAIQTYALDAGDLGASALHVLGALFFRNAFMLDHREMTPGVWRYAPPDAAVAYLMSACPVIGELPVPVLLHLVEALALNEDVKYCPPGTPVTVSGRQNNMLTCAHMTAVFLNAARIGKFVDAMTRGRGVAPIGQQSGIDIFRLLSLPAGSEGLCFEDSVLDRCRVMLGRTIQEMVRSTGLEPDPSRRKDRVAAEARRTLGQVLGEEDNAALWQNFNVKTIRVNDEGVPAEDVSFSTIRQDIAVTESWDSSELKLCWQRPFLFNVFSVSTSKEERFLGMAFCSIPSEDLDERAQGVWRNAIRGLLRGDRSALPKKSESEFFVRDHGSHKTVGPDGETTTPLAFWLSGEYVQALIEGRGSRGIGRYGSAMPVDE